MFNQHFLHTEVMQELSLHPYFFVYILHVQLGSGLPKMYNPDDVYTTEIFKCLYIMQLTACRSIYSHRMLIFNV